MQLKVYSIFDEKAKCFGQPFFMAHNGMALRAFSDLVADKSTSINKHPGDYKLYCLADYDDNSGEFASLPQPEFLAHASDFVNDAVIERS